jgi:hypothetical protein
MEFPEIVKFEFAVIFRLPLATELEVELHAAFEVDDINNN